MDILKKYPGTAAAVSFVAGLIIGLVVLGWWLFPVQFTGTTPSGLFPEYQDIYVRNVAELYAFDQNQEKAVAALEGWGGDAVACELAASTNDSGAQQRLIVVATLVNGTGCTGAIAPTTPESAEGEGNSILPLLLLGALLLGLAGAIYWVYSRRQQMLDEDPMPDDVAPLAASASPQPVAPAAGDSRPAMTPVTPVQPPPEPVAVPIARFRTNYSRGHDTYDDSFSIENSSGEFLGECGVGISEVIGAGSPKNVTAFEVWLFDKNDIRTITKVIMSDHAFFDEALKAKLAPKGEPVLARENETIVLETAALIINAEITEIVYGGSPEMPERSYFDLFTIELSAWSKVSDTPGGDSVDDVLDY